MAEQASTSVSATASDLIFIPVPPMWEMIRREVLREGAPPHLRAGRR